MCTVQSSGETLAQEYKAWGGTWNRAGLPGGPSTEDQHDSHAAACAGCSAKTFERSDHYSDQMLCLEGCIENPAMVNGRSL